MRTPQVFAALEFIEPYVAEKWPVAQFKMALDAENEDARWRPAQRVDERGAAVDLRDTDRMRKAAQCLKTLSPRSRIRWQLAVWIGFLLLFPFPRHLARPSFQS